MALRHIALFRFVDDAAADDIAALREALAALPAQIDHVRTYMVGADLALSDRTWDFAVVGDFDDVAAYEAYRTHPAHVKVIDEHVNPLVAERAAVQVEF